MAIRSGHPRNKQQQQPQQQQQSQQQSQQPKQKVIKKLWRPEKRTMRSNLSLERATRSPGRSNSTSPLADVQSKASYVYRRWELRGYSHYRPLQEVMGKQSKSRGTLIQSSTAMFHTRKTLQRVTNLK
jgi:hypothetical protein